MPPCAGWDGSDNGGATERGVSADRVLVVRYVQTFDPATQAILENLGVADDPEVVENTYRALFEYSNQHYQTYGREVRFVTYEATGAPSDDTAMKFDAQKIAEELKPFAVIDAPTTTARELASRGVICVCNQLAPSSFYTERPPLVFGGEPTIDEYATHISEYLAKRLADRPALHAGDELNARQRFTTTPRRFGLVWFKGEGREDPELARGHDTLVNTLRTRGISLAADVGYVYDPGRSLLDAANIVAQLKAARVTTVIPLVDPVSPIFITREATNQTYFPEWFITGFFLTDGTTVGRWYDQEQWRHAFGISRWPVGWARMSDNAGFREYHHARPADPPGTEGLLIDLYRIPVQLLFRGIHMAGPVLTNRTFAAGMFAYPPTGGTPFAPLNVHTRASPTATKDFTEIWYDADRSGPNEVGEEGQGMLVRVDGGRRYRAGEWPTTAPRVFVEDGTEVAVSRQGRDPPHEEDGHSHRGRCLSCR